MDNTEVQLSDLVIGSDKEKATLRAVQQSFPSTLQILCQHQLEENVCQPMQQKVGLPESTRNNIISLTFGNDGLINCKDLVDFELGFLSLSNKLLQIAPNFKPKISTNSIPINWTNNESLNNILKLSTNWKVLKSPDLVEIMHLIVKLQYADMRTALHGHRNYEIAPKLRHFESPNSVWAEKNEAEKKSIFEKFLSVTVKKK